MRMLAQAVQPQLHTPWLERVGTLRRNGSLRLPGLDDPLQPHGLIRAVAQLTSPDAAITTDVGQHQMWVAQSYPFTRPERWLTSGGLGTMGFGLPAAIGAALALPESGAVCFTGDGSLLMNIQELATLVELGLNVKTLVMDNAALGMVRQQQQLFYQGRYSNSLYAQKPDFAAIASAFGVPAWDLGRGDPQRMLQDAFAQPGPALIRVPIAAEELVLPMVPAGAANTEMID